MSLIATLFTKSCTDGALVPAGGVWARAIEANRPQPTVISSDLFMICTSGLCGSRAAQLTNLVALFWFRNDLGVLCRCGDGTSEVVQADIIMRPGNAIGWRSQIEYRPGRLLPSVFSPNASLGEIPYVHRTAVALMGRAANLPFA
jgi:hypothetical protein